jgi:iron complex outermembrane receptor protein
VLLILVCLASSIHAQKEDQLAANVSLDSLLNMKINTAAKYEQTAREAPASVTIVTSGEIRQFGYRTLDEVLSHVRGFYTSYDRNYGYVGARGFGRPTDYNDRILLLEDGHTLNENFYGGTSIGTDFPIAMESIERIEVVRGPGSALYGTGAMLGVINIITKKGNAVDGLQAFGEIGSFQRLQGTIMYGKQWGNNSDLMVSGIVGDVKGTDLYYTEYDNPSTNYGVAQNLDWDRFYGISAKYSVDNLTLHGRATSRSKGIPTGSFEMIFDDDRAQTLDNIAFFEGDYRFNFSSDKSLSARVSFDHYDYHGKYPYAVLQEDENQCNWLGSELKFQWDIGSSNRFTAGMEFKNNFRAYYRNWDADTVYFDANFPFNVTSLYLQDEYQLSSNLNLTLGVRRDEYTTAGSATIPRGGIVYSFMDKSATLKLLYGEGFRAPNIYETEYYDVNSGYKSNHNLEPEKIHTGELVWEQRWADEWLGTASFYHYDMKNLIDTKIDPVDSLKQFQNLNNVRANGFELEVNGRLKMGLGLNASYSYQDVVDGDTHVKLTNSPSHLADIRLTYPFFAYLSAALEMQYQSERVTVYQTTTPPFVLTNLNLIGHQFIEHVEFSLLVRNLFNVDYSLPGGFEHLQPGIQQDGRSFIARLELKY